MHTTVRRKTVPERIDHKAEPTFYLLLTEPKNLENLTLQGWLMNSDASTPGSHYHSLTRQKIVPLTSFTKRISVKDSTSSGCGLQNGWCGKDKGSVSSSGSNIGISTHPENTPGGRSIQSFIRASSGLRSLRTGVLLVLSATLSVTGHIQPLQACSGSFL